MVSAFAHGAMDRWIDPSWGGNIEPFLPFSCPNACANSLYVCAYMFSYV